MTKEEFLKATGKELTEEASWYEGIDLGVYLEVEVEGETIEMIGEFGDEEIIEYAKEKYGEEVEDTADAILDFYEGHDYEIDAYFIDQQYGEKERKELIEEAFGD